MKNVEAIKLIETVGADTAIKVAESTGSSKTLSLVKNVAKRIGKQPMQATLPGIPLVTDGIEAVPVRGQTLRSKQNQDYAAVYADVPNAMLPLADMGYESQRVFSQYRNGQHVIYKAMHYLNIKHRRGVTTREIFEVLQSAPSCGGHAFFLQFGSVAAMLSANKYGLWRKAGVTKRCPGVSGARSYLWVAAGLTPSVGKRGRKSK